jgi:hypothetical protein
LRCLLFGQAEFQLHRFRQLCLSELRRAALGQATTALTAST